MKNRFLCFAAIIIMVPLIVVLILTLTKPKQFDQNKAYQNLQDQMSLGPRIPGSEAHAKFITWLTNSLKNKAGLWKSRRAKLKGIL